MNIPALIALCLLLPNIAAAGPDRVSVLLGSAHIGAAPSIRDGRGYNQINPGLFLTWETDHVDWTIGAYLNSFERGSVSATAGLPIFTWD